MLFRKNVRRTVQIIASCEARRRALLRDVARRKAVRMLDSWNEGTAKSAIVDFVNTFREERTWTFSRNR